jgi:ubiquitin C-terminal hydrolase
MSIQPSFLLILPATPSHFMLPALGKRHNAAPLSSAAVCLRSGLKSPMQGATFIPEVDQSILAVEASPAPVAIDPCLLPLPSMGGRHGFANIGNTCFFNSAIQPLLHIEPLMHLMMFEPSLIACQQSPGSSKQRAVAEEFALIAKRVWARDCEGMVRQQISPSACR